MKKLIAILLCVTMLLVMTSCTATSDGTKSQEPSASSTVSTEATTKPTVAATESAKPSVSSSAPAVTTSAAATTTTSAATATTSATKAAGDVKDMTFSFAKDTAGWYIGSPQVTSLKSSKKLLNITVKGATPIILSSEFKLPSEDHYMVIRMKNNTNANSMNMFFKNDVDTPAFTGEAVETFNVNSNDTAMTEYVVDMSQSSHWKGNITQCRFDFYSTPGDYNGDIQIESITFTSKAK